MNKEVPRGWDSVNRLRQTTENNNKNKLEIIDKATYASEVATAKEVSKLCSFKHSKVNWESLVRLQAVQKIRST